MQRRSFLSTTGAESVSPALASVVPRRVPVSTENLLALPVMDQFPCGQRS